MFAAPMTTKSLWDIHFLGEYFKMPLLDLTNSVLEYNGARVTVFTFERAPEKPWFCGKELAHLLDYADTKKAIDTHVPVNCVRVLRDLISEFGTPVGGGRGGARGGAAPPLLCEGERPSEEIDRKSVV